jgi:4-diphosphocytidyl-2-C-methyl-D-erythritol kinase
MKPCRALAPAKVNMGLLLGPRRPADGRHELVTVMQSISLADELTLEPAPAGASADELVCPGVPGPARENLAAAALGAFRAGTGWDGPPLRLSIVKRIPLAAGLGGGSADAAAALRLASHASGLGDERLLLELAARLGADVPAQVAPGRWLATGAGERLRELSDHDPNLSLGLLVLPLAVQLSSAAVYAEADRLGLARAPRALEERRRALGAGLDLRAPPRAGGGPLQNDLERAAISLCPVIVDALAQARDAGAQQAFVSGSGPTVVGLFYPRDGLGRAERAASRLRGRTPAPICAVPVDSAFARAASVARQEG